MRRRATAILAPRARSLSSLQKSSTLHRLSTTPNAKLYVSGSCDSLIVKTNHETYLATLEVDAAGINAAAEVCEASSDVKITTSGGAATVSVPAAFNVDVDVSGACDVDVQGWIEGTVHVTVGTGDVAVNTVRGLLTSVATGGGDVRVQHVEGNLDVRAGGTGAVTLGKIMGEEVRIAATGAMSARAVYAKELELQAGGGVKSSVLAADDGELKLGGDSDLSLTSGRLRLEVSAGNVSVQATDQLSELHVAHSAAAAVFGSGGESGESGESGGGSRPTVDVQLPEGLAARLHAHAATISVDDSLTPRDVAVAMPSSKHAQEEKGTATAGDRPAEDGHGVSRRVLLGGGSGGPGAGGGRRAKRMAAEVGGGAAPGCELTVYAAGCDVSVRQRSWLETMASWQSGERQAKSSSERQAGQAGLSPVTERDRY